MFSLTSIKEIEDLVLGATILGTGGGSPEEGLKLLEEALAIAKEIKIIDLDEVPSDS
ncbi:MAG: DUF917 domain-containing protein, partial [Thermoprotei archaeon]